MKEWSNPYNAFNSIKILLWRQHLEACAKGNYLTPVMIDLDPSGKCNFNCPHCNASNIIDNDRQDLPKEHWINLIDYLYDWSKDTLSSVCISGGGEPFMNKATPAILESIHKYGIEIGVITNGSLLTDDDINVLVETCRWVGISMDAATSETYNKLKGIKGNLFDKVCENIRKLTNRVKVLNKLNDIDFKFLLGPSNYMEIYDAAVLAKSLGVRDFHVRPVGYLNVSKLEGKTLEFTPEMLDLVNKQVEKAMELEDGFFRVFGVRHKFTTNFQPRKNFSRCWCIPMLPTFGADGFVHTCFDTRGREDLIMCKHFEIADFWNSTKHKEMIKNIDITTCPRCTFSTYNEVVEQVFIKDGMCRNFL